MTHKYISEAFEQIAEKNISQQSQIMIHKGNIKDSLSDIYMKTDKWPSLVNVHLAGAICSEELLILTT